MLCMKCGKPLCEAGEIPKNLYCPECSPVQSGTQDNTVSPNINKESNNQENIRTHDYTELNNNEFYPSEHAGFWLRFWAMLFDTALLNIASSFIVLILVLSLGYGLFKLDDLALQYPDYFILLSLISGIIIILISLIILAFSSFIYNVLFEISSFRATPGKLLFGIEVVDDSEETIGLGGSIIRNISKVISGLIFGIGFLMAAFTREKQALHDIMAGAFVVRSRNLSTIQFVVGLLITIILCALSGALNSFLDLKSDKQHKKSNFKQFNNYKHSGQYF